MLQSAHFQFIAYPSQTQRAVTNTNTARSEKTSQRRFGVVLMPTILTAVEKRDAAQIGDSSRVLFFYLRLKDQRRRG